MPGSDQKHPHSGHSHIGEAAEAALEDVLEHTAAGGGAAGVERDASVRDVHVDEDLSAQLHEEDLGEQLHASLGDSHETPSVSCSAHTQAFPDIHMLTFRKSRFGLCIRAVKKKMKQIRGP